MKHLQSNIHIYTVELLIEGVKAAVYSIGQEPHMLFICPG